MTDSEKVQELIDLSKGEIAAYVFKVWNHEDFFQLCDILLEETCERLVKDFPKLDIDSLHQAALSSMGLLIEYSADAIRGFLRQTEQVNLTRRGKILHFRQM